MRRIALLTLVREDELSWRKTLTSYFRQTGDYLSYALFPAIVMPERDSIDGDIDIGDGCFTLAPAPVHNGFCWVLPVENLSMGAGLFLTTSPSIGDYVFPGGEVRVSGAALAETGENSFKVIRRRPLSRDRGH